MQLREIMTEGVVTAEPNTPALDVARLMRDHNVGSVVIVDGSGTPCAMLTDRDLAVRVLAEESDLRGPVSDRVSAPLISGEPETSLEEAAALMVQHRIRRLPVIDGDRLAGIVTLDDIAVRTGDLDVAQKMTQQVLEGALPQFYFRDRGG